MTPHECKKLRQDTRELWSELHDRLIFFSHILVNQAFARMVVDFCINKIGGPRRLDEMPNLSAALAKRRDNPRYRIKFAWEAADLDIDWIREILGAKPPTTGK